MIHQIQIASLSDAEKLALIVRNSNKDVADKFDITFENNPKHPSFYTKEWVLKDFERGEEYFLYQENNEYLGCVAFEQPNTETAYLNRLSVLPMYRRNGIGEKLVTHIIEHSKEKNVKTISIGIITKHEQLKTWYSKLGFKEGDTKIFSHLPFDVTFMHYEL